MVANSAVTSTPPPAIRRMLALSVMPPIILLLLLTSIFIWQLYALLDEIAWATQADATIEDIYRARTRQLDRETGLRGFLLTGQDSFLEPYTTGSTEITPLLSTLREDLADDPPQLARLEQIGREEQAWTTAAEELISLRRSNGDYANLVSAGYAKQHMDAMRTLFTEMQDEERNLLAARRQEINRSTRTVVGVSLLGALLGAALLGSFVLRQTRQVSSFYQGALANAEQRRNWLQSVLDGIDDGVIATDADRRVLFLNGVAEKLTGWKNEEAYQHLVQDVVHLEAAHTGNGADGKLQSISPLTTMPRAVLRNREGNPLPIESSAVTLAAASEAARGNVIVLRDLTKQQAMEQELADSDARFRQVTEVMPQMVWTTLADGYHEYFNRRWYDYTGTTMEQVRGEGWSGFLHPDDYDRTWHVWKHSLETGEPYEIEYRFREASTGQYRWFLGRALPMHNGVGTIVRWFGTCTDIHDQRLAVEQLAHQNHQLEVAREQLEARNRELDQFAYVTSHDLKAPLRGIANLSQWIEEDLGAEVPEEVQQHLELLRGRVHRMEGLIDGLLQYSRIGRVKQDTVIVQVDELLKEVVDFVAPPAGMTIEIDSAMPTLETDRLQLRQVFQNLIQNAIKHHHQPSQGHIHVRCQEGDQYYIFSVADDGPGIAEQYHERIFGIFQTLSPRDKVEGSGLGLSLVKKMVEMQGGKIWIESQEQQGATFFFQWPKQSTR